MDGMASKFGEDIFSGPTFALITGASQGLGRSIAIALAVKVSKGSVIAISARNGDGLKQTEAIALKKRIGAGRDGDVEFVTVVADLSDFKDVATLVDSSVIGRRSFDFPTALLVHNAGTIGDISKEMCDFSDPGEVNDYFRLNLAHLPPITGKFVRWRGIGSGLKTIVVNVSSLLALQPGQCFSLYAAGKAARDVLFRVLAVENPDVKVLSWAPGPLLTPMSEKVWATSNRHQTKIIYQKMRDEGKYLTCEESTSKLIDILQNDQYQSGDHVDYFD